MKKRQRKGANHSVAPEVSTCTSCGAAKMPHRVCGSCGNYNGKQVLTVTAD
jgi:large subunit ribosomal protein L32